MAAREDDPRARPGRALPHHLAAPQGRRPAAGDTAPARRAGRRGCRGLIAWPRFLLRHNRMSTIIIGAGFVALQLRRTLPGGAKYSVVRAHPLTAHNMGCRRSAGPLS